MNFKEYIKEDKPIGAKNKELWQEFLKKYFDKDVSDLFLTFVSEDKVGINPRSKYDTPIGVYAYPLSYLQKLIEKGEDVPFRSMSPKKVKILKKVSDKVLSDKLSESDFNKCIEKLEKYKIDNDLKLDTKFEDFIEYASFRANVQSYFGKLWNITRMLSADYYRKIRDKHGNKIHGPSQNIAVWSKILEYLGFDVIVDNGTGVIHSNEPYQALFINPKSYKVIDEEFVDSESRYFDKVKEYTIGNVSVDASRIHSVKEYEIFIKNYKNRIEKLLKTQSNGNKRNMVNSFREDFKIDFIKRFRPYFDSVLKENMHLFNDLFQADRESLTEFKDEFNVLMSNKFPDFIENHSGFYSTDYLKTIYEKLYYGISEYIEKKKIISFFKGFNRDDLEKEKMKVFLDEFKEPLKKVFEDDPTEILYVPDEYKLEIIKRYKEAFSKSVFDKYIIKDEKIRDEVNEYIQKHIKESVYVRISKIL